MHALPQLPYEYGALEPYIDAHTVEIHYDKHHRTYVNNLNKLITENDLLSDGNKFENMSLEEIIKKASAGPIFNNAAQIWNHTFYWESLARASGSTPDGRLLEAIIATF